MKKLFTVLLNLLSFGIPLFIQMLSKAKRFNDIINSNVHVTLISYRSQSMITLELGYKRRVKIYLDIDEFSEEYINTSSTEKEEKYENI